MPPKIICRCCGKYLSAYHARRHADGKGGTECQIQQARRDLAAASQSNDTSHGVLLGVDSLPPSPSHDEVLMPDVVIPDDWIEHIPPGDDDPDGPDDDLGHSSDSDSADNHGMSSDNEWDEDHDDEELGAREVAAILEEWDAEARAVEDHLLMRDVLTDEDRDNLKMFALRLSFQLLRRFHDQIRAAYSDKIRLHSLYVMHRRIAILSGIKPLILDCCPESCCAYTGKFAEKDACPFCSTPRRSESDKPQATFEYLPIIPRLQAIFWSPESMERLRYRTEREESHNIIADIFDGDLYKSLRGRHVVVDGVEYDHCYFDDWRDIPTGLLGDGFQLFKRSRKGHSTAWPFILINYALPPEIRTHIENIIPLFIIPGPNTPKNFSSFLYPFVQDSKLLAIGVRTLDASILRNFMMRSHTLTNLGDMISIRHTQCMKGPNGLSPCHTCRIQGFRDRSHGKKIYYVPLQPPAGTAEHAAGLAWDPGRLPLRTDAEVVQQLAEIRAAPTKKERKRKAMVYGINGDSVLFEIPSMSRTQSFPFDFMHLLFENHIPNMVKFWKGTYAPNLDEGTEEYVIAPNIWEEIGKETAVAASLIPSRFVSALPNVYQDSHLYTAEMWSFWFVNVAPHVLKGRFPRPKYYHHMMQLVEIIKMALLFSISREELADLRSKIIEYIKTYERYYYQYKPERLTACRLTVHALLHIVDDIKRTGPVWVNWTFVMERFCGLLLPAVKSKRKPYACLNRRILHVAQLVQLAQQFNLTADLQFEAPQLRVSSHEYESDACPGILLRWPRKSHFLPDNTILNKIIAYFRTMFGCARNTIKKMLPEYYERWGSLRLGNDGDIVRGRYVLPDVRRDNSFVRYTLLVDKQQRNHRRKPEFVERICYGQLYFVIICRLPASRALELDEPSTHVLALVEPCKTRPPGGDASKEVVSYSKPDGPSAFININTIQCGIGRIRVKGKRWGLIDRTGDYVRTTFSNGEDDG